MQHDMNANPEPSSKPVSARPERTCYSPPQVVKLVTVPETGTVSKINESTGGVLEAS